mgnify:FL=1
MNRDFFIRLVERDCPFCDRNHQIEERKRYTKSLVKDEAVEYEELYCRCPLTDEEENEFVPAKVMDENLLRARDSYRVKKGLLTSEEIAEIREEYSLTQTDFSALLGWGDVTITRYETKSIQDETYDQMMRMVYGDPMFALEALDRHREHFSIEKYRKLRSRIVERVKSVGNKALRRREIASQYVLYEEESDLNGYTKLDLDKVEKIIAYFATYVLNLYKVKLMKLLWYADAIHFSRYGKAMTGLVYTHMPLGALPVAHDSIINLPSVRVEEEFINFDLCYRIVPNTELSLTDFSLEEQEVLQLVASKFKNMNSKEIVEYMHLEKAYLETEPYQAISFFLAQELREIK